MSWSTGLRPASWRGVPFSVLAGQAELARRTAIHEYPYRDDVWAEDLGRGRNSWALTGRLVGEDAVARRDQMQAAADTPGPGELIHPTFGSLTVTCIGFQASEAWDNGRVIELSFLFIKDGGRKYPAGSAATGSAVENLAETADAAAEGDFLDKAKAAFQGGREAINNVVATAQSYAGAAQRIVNDATSALHSVGSFIPGADKVISRFERGARSVLGKTLGVATNYINKAASARSGVERLATNVTATANRL